MYILLQPKKKKNTLSKYLPYNCANSIPIAHNPRGYDWQPFYASYIKQEVLVFNGGPEILRPPPSVEMDQPYQNNEYLHNMLIRSWGILIRTEVC